MNVQLPTNIFIIYFILICHVIIVPSFSQAFVRLSLGVHEIFFVAMADKKTHRYKFELDMVTNAEDFAEQSGSYSIVSMGVWAYECMEISVLGMDLCSSSRL